MRAPSNILDVAQRLGARLKRVTAIEWAGPCPTCEGRDRFSVNIKRGVFNCRGCDVGGDDVALARHVLGCDFGEALEFVGDERAQDRASFPGTPPPNLGRQVSRQVAAEPLVEHPDQGARPSAARHGAGHPEDDTQRTADAVAMFRESLDPVGTIVERYFASRRLEIDDVAGRTIRWNPRIGAMIALFRNIQTGKPQAVSRTFLDAEARKVKRKFLGPVGGAAVMLDPFDSITSGLHIAEGIETAQAGRQLGLRPTWALGSAGAVASFPVLGGIECLTLLAENDPASERAVSPCGERWHDAGRNVLINRPLKGKDLNDALQRRAA